jgi:hypothetical protein
MATISTPVFTDSVAITGVALQAITKTVTPSARGTFKVPGFGAYVLLGIGRGGTTALSPNGVVPIIRRLIGHGVGGAATSLYIPPTWWTAQSDTVAAVSTACAAAGNNAGATTLTLNAAATYTAGDLLIVTDGVTGGAAPTAANTEFARVAVTSSASTSLILDSPTTLAHNSTSHFVRNHANLYAVWCEGGPDGTATYEILFDYGGATAGDQAMVIAVMQTFDSISNA